MTDSPQSGLAEFLDPVIGPYSLDSYWARFTILKAIKEALPEFRGTLLDVGCGHMPYRSLLTAPPSRVIRYVGLDLEANSYNNQPDLMWDGISIPLPSLEIDCALATEVLEHCPDPIVVLREIHRVLKPSGFFLTTVPFLWPLHDIPHDEFRYTPFALQRMLLDSGFVDVDVQPVGGWNASLAQMMGLWIRRRPMNELLRRILQRLATPVYRQLLARDRPPTVAESCMITGVIARARKPGSN